MKYSTELEHQQNLYSSVEEQASTVHDIRHARDSVTSRGGNPHVPRAAPAKIIETKQNTAKTTPPETAHAIRVLNEACHGSGVQFFQQNPPSGLSTRGDNAARSLSRRQLRQCIRWSSHASNRSLMCHPPSPLAGTHTRGHRIGANEERSRTRRRQ